MNRVRSAGGLLLAAVTAGCSGDPAERTMPIVWDSAGVRIVENGEASTEGWRVPEEPLFTVGWDLDGLPGGSPGPIGVKGRAGSFAEGFAWARSDEPEVRWYDGSGRVVQVSRWDQEATPLTPDRRSRILKAHEDLLRDRGAEESFVTAQLAHVEEGLDRHEGPLPYWESLHVDRLGNVWLSAYGPPGLPEERWRVFARDGRFQGWVDLPEVMAILDITEDRVLAVRFDELDVPAAVMLELIKRRWLRVHPRRRPASARSLVTSIRWRHEAEPGRVYTHGLRVGESTEGLAGRTA